jgi:hypothetical protein
MEHVQVAVDTLVDSRSPVRTTIDPGWVDRLAKAGAPFAPIVVTREGRLVDGWHRAAAAASLGLTHLDAIVIEAASEAEVVEAAARANLARPLSLADRKAAALRLLALEPTWSDRRVAASTGTSPTSVKTWRPAACAGVQLDTCSRRSGRDGKQYPATRPSRRPGDPAPPPVQAARRRTRRTIRRLARTLRWLRRWLASMFTRRSL